MKEVGSVELVRLGFEMFEREGPTSFRALIDLANPEIECYAAPGIEPSGRHHGHEAVLRWLEEWFEAWEEFSMQPIEFIEADEGVVVVLLHQVARGRESGVEVETDVAYVFQTRDGRFTRFHIYPDNAQALIAAREMGASG